MHQAKIIRRHTDHSPCRRRTLTSPRRWPEQGHSGSGTRFQGILRRDKITQLRNSSYGVPEMKFSMLRKSVPRTYEGEAALTSSILQVQRRAARPLCPLRRRFWCQRFSKETWCRSAASPCEGYFCLLYHGGAERFPESRKQVVTEISPKLDDLNILAGNKT